MKKLTLLFLVVAFSVSGLLAQVRIQGKVTDAQGLPIPGVSVSEKGTTKGTATNANGLFSLEVSGKTALIKFFMLGFQTQELAIPESNEFTVVLKENTTSLSEVVVVGSRSLRRSATETAVPVDVIDLQSVIKQTGKLEMNRLLEYAAPSFNANKQTGSDGADHIDPATIRGLGPDQTLVLINGKRRHQSSLINLFGTRGRGNTGTDLNAIPVASIERVEVLRDGASAQYGSDAIAGVVNIVLKKNVNEFNGFINTGAYDAPGYADKNFDGQTVQFAGNYGAQLGEKGFINFSMNFLNNQKTRRVEDPSTSYRRQFGDASGRDFGTFVNASLPVSNQTEIYAFGGFSNRFTDAFAWSRDAGADNNVDAIYPNGFDPHIQSNIDDKSISTGIKTKWNSWDVDFNNTFGTNRMHYYVDGTLNASLGIKSPTFFDAGGFQFSQNTTGINFTRAYDKVASGLNVAFGTEYRVDRYAIFAGEEGSYKNYSDPNNPIPGGSQGFPGFQPRNEVNVSRSNLAAYTDVELDVTKQYLVTAAVRYENYSDFGGTLNGKLAMRYRFSDAFNLRGSVSTGFRAPSLQQTYFNTIFTNFVNGQPTEVLLSNNLSTVTRTLGIERLKQERSVNQSLGFTWKPLNNLNITVDAYQVNIKDRIVLTGSFFDNDPDIGADLTALGVTQAQFFTNAIDSRNRGIDVIFTHDMSVGTDGRLVTSFAANFNKLTIQDIKTNDKLAGKEDTYFSERERAFVEASAPRSKMNLNFDYSNKKFTSTLRIVRFGDVVLRGWDNSSMYYTPKITTDLSFGYRLSKSLSFNFGADNLLNVYPDKQDQSLTEAGGAWDSVQMNYNGRRYFARLGFTF